MGLRTFLIAENSNFGYCATRFAVITVNIIHMLFFEAFIKFSSVGLLIALGLLIVRDGLGSRALRFCLPAITAICFILITTGSPAISLMGPVVIPLRLFDSLITIFIWWLGLALFDDDFEIGKQEWFISGLFAAVMIPTRLHFLGFGLYWHYSIEIIVSCFSFSLMVHLCYKALAGRQEDLIEQRRRIRIWFVVAVALTGIASNVVERLTQLIGNYEMATFWVTYILTLPITLCALLWLARVHPEVLAFDSKRKAKNELSDMDARHKTAHEKLVSIMEIDNVYVNHGLAIGELADLVGIPAHQLRKLINQTMGYRNFSSFLNKYRISAIKKALSDPEKARTPILTLAIEAGFSSLAPFNRAFKASEGVTPTDFRAQHLAHHSEKAVQN